MSSHPGDDDSSTDASPPVDWETLYRLVSRPERRYTLSYLVERDGPADAEELARVVAARRDGHAPADAEDRQWESLLTSLVHVHLPKLRNGGLVEWDRDDGRVRLTRAGRRAAETGLPGQD
jgi:DNA-binding transcriptional ArsR family regulator